MKEADEYKVTSSEVTVDRMKFIMPCQYWSCLVDCSIDCQKMRIYLKDGKLSLVAMLHDLTLPDGWISQVLLEGCCRS